MHPIAEPGEVATNGLVSGKLTPVWSENKPR